jgi:hypothetical protein
MMSNEQFAELELRVAICPGQCQWPKPENITWQQLHNAASEARERVSRFYLLADEIDRNAILSEDDKYCERSKAADEAFAKFEASKTLVRAREAVRYDGNHATMKALEQAEVGWERAMNKIAERAGRTKGPDTRR